MTAATPSSYSLSSTEAHLVSDDAPYTIHGVAIGGDDVTKGSSGTKKFWPADELEEASDSLEGRPLVVDHENNSAHVVGRVTKSGWVDNVGVVYEAELYDKDLADKIESGLLEVSVRGYHIPTEQMERHVDSGALTVENVEFDNLSIVPKGAAPSNTLQMGEHDELEAAELSLALDEMTSELAEWATGDWVQWDDGETHGMITLGPELEGQNNPQVETYVKNDSGEWYPSGETQTIEPDSLETWDVDVDNITSAPDSEENAYDEDDFDIDAGDEVKWHSGHGVVKEFTDDGEVLIEPYAKDDDVWKPTNFEVEVAPPDVSMWDVAAEILDRQGNVYEAAEVSRGDWVEWDTRNSTEKGKVTEVVTVDEDMPEIRGSRNIEPDEDDPVVVLRMYKWGADDRFDVDTEKWHPIDGKPIAHKMSCVRSWSDHPSDDETSSTTVELTAELNEGDYVQWDVDGEKAYGQVIERTDSGCLEDEVNNQELCADDDTDKTALQISIYNDGYDTEVLTAQYEQTVSEWQNTDVSENSLVREGMSFFDTSNDSLITVLSVDGDTVRVRNSQGDSWDEYVDLIVSKLSNDVWRVATGDDMSDGLIHTGLRFFSTVNDSFITVLDVSGKEATVEAEDGSQWVEPVHTIIEKLADEKWLTAGHSDVTENGPSNTDTHPVGENDWVQWYPETGPEEAHGKVEDVNEYEDEDKADEVVVRMYKQDDEGTWHPTDHTKRFPMSEVEGWGNYPTDDAISDERLSALASDARKSEGDGDDNDVSADDELDEDTKKALKNKVEEHNEEHVEDGNEDSKKVTYSMLKDVFERGIGAYNDSHRPGMAPTQWALARVNAFLYLVRNGNPENDNYKQDNDLLPEGHDKYSASEENRYNPTEGDMVQWQAKPSLFGKIVHVDEAKNIAMVTVHDTDSDGDLYDTGYTVTAGFGDLLPFDDADHSDAEENTLTTDERLSLATELDEDSATMDELDEVFDDWQEAVNMSPSELREWSKHPCSREASVEPVAVIKRNLRLLETNKDEWDEHDIADAKRTVSFVNRMSDDSQKPDDIREGPHGCPSEWAISLLNWAYNPFDSLPEKPDDLDEVDEVELKLEGVERRAKKSDKSGQPHRYPECEHDDDCDCSELEAEIRTVEFDDTTESESWDGLDLEDFTDKQWDEMSEDEQMDVANHFLISRDGWPPENFSDLGFEVVDTDGDLDLQALRAAKTRSGQAGDDIDESQLKSVINELATENFDVNWMEENMIDSHNVPSRSHHKGKEYDVKTYMYEKGKADGMYDCCSPKRTVSSLKMHGDHSEESDDSEEELAYGEYEHEEMMAYENGYHDGASSAEAMDMAEMMEHGHSEKDSDEMMDSFAKGMHDGMDPDEADTDEMSAHMPDEEAMAYHDGHKTGCKYRRHNKHPNLADTSEMTDSEMTTDASSSVDDLQQVSLAERTTGIAALSTHTTTMKFTEEELEDYENPTVVEESDLEELRSMNENIEELRERTEVLDEVERELVEELRETDEPLVVSEDRFSELEQEAEHVKQIYAEELAEETPYFDSDELMQKHSLDELREKFDEMGGEIEEELNADPRGSDPAEEELGADDGGESETEELVAAKQAELKEKIGN